MLIFLALKVIFRDYMQRFITMLLKHLMTVFFVVEITITGNKSCLPVFIKMVCFRGEISFSPAHNGLYLKFLTSIPIGFHMVHTGASPPPLQPDHGL